MKGTEGASKLTCSFCGFDICEGDAVGFGGDEVHGALVMRDIDALGLSCGRHRRLGKEQLNEEFEKPHSVLQ